MRRSKREARATREWAVEVELRKDPREAITPVVAAAILVNYFLLPVYLGVILLRRIQVLLYMDMLDLQGPAVPGCDPLRIRAGSERASSNPVGPGGGGAGTVNGPGLLGGQCNQPAAGVRRAPGVPLDRWLAIPVELWCKEWPSCRQPCRSHLLTSLRMWRLSSLGSLSCELCNRLRCWLHGLQNHMGDLRNSSGQW